MKLYFFIVVSLFSYFLTVRIGSWPLGQEPILTVRHREFLLLKIWAKKACQRLSNQTFYAGIKKKAS
jgi:hypothetical protein